MNACEGARGNLDTFGFQFKQKLLRVFLNVVTSLFNYLHANSIVARFSFFLFDERQNIVPEESSWREETRPLTCSMEEGSLQSFSNPSSRD